MLISIRYNKNAGNAAIYARIRNATGQFWDFTGLAWVSPETANCRVFFTERADGDAAESLFLAEVTIPAGGPWVSEAVRIDTGAVLGNDTTAIDANVSSRSTFDGSTVATITNPVTVGTNNDKTGYSLTADYNPAKTAATQASADLIAGGVADAQSGINLLLTGVGTLLDIGQGKWEIAANQMIFYDRAGDELQRFNLQDLAGSPTMGDVFKRVPV